MLNSYKKLSRLQKIACHAWSCAHQTLFRSLLHRSLSLSCDNFGALWKYSEYPCSLQVAKQLQTDWKNSCNRVVRSGAYCLHVAQVCVHWMYNIQYIYTYIREISPLNSLVLGSLTLVPISICTDNISRHTDTHRHLHTMSQYTHQILVYIYIHTPGHSQVTDNSWALH